MPEPLKQRRTATEKRTAVVDAEMRKKMVEWYKKESTVTPRAETVDGGVNDNDKKKYNNSNKYIKSNNRTTKQSDSRWMPVGSGEDEEEYCGIYSEDDDELLTKENMKWKVREIMTAAYAKQTMATRRSAQRLFVRWTKQHQKPINQNSLMLWAANAPNLKWSTRSAYYNHGKAMLNPKEQIEIFSRGLARLKAQEDTKKAALMTHDEILELMMSLPTTRDKVALYVAVRTACRMDELLNLKPTVFTGTDNRSIYLHWKHHTKGTQMNPDRPDTFVELREEHAESEYTYPVTMNDVRKTIWKVAETEGKNSPISTLSYERWLNYMKKVNPNATGHSIKRTASTRALEMVIQWQLPLCLVGRLAKHKNQEADIKEVTLKYIGNPILPAKALRTGDLVQYL